MKEIRWHGRAGQGAKSVAQILGLALMKSGYFVQAFPEYGPERSGAPVQAYTRISDRPIRIRFGITEPDTVVVLDDSLVGEIEVLAGLPEDGVAIVNTTADSRPRVGFDAGDERIRLVDADGIAHATGGRFANVVMMGALAAVRTTPSIRAVYEAVTETFGAKLPQHLLEANILSVRSGYDSILDKREQKEREHVTTT